jgi:hypothetical protein
MTMAALYAVISDPSLAQSILDSVSEDYVISMDKSIEDIVDRMAEAKPDIILCEQCY